MRKKEEIILRVILELNGEEDNFTWKESKKKLVRLKNNSDQI